jgi:Ca2+-binding RTX toxin-like protein
MTVWDGGGTDTYDLSNYSGASTIDLRPGEWVTTSPAQFANLGEARIARGNVANALLYQDSPQSLIENAVGGSGNNFILANQAANHLTGNGGNDTFIWKSIADAGTGALADTIMDFTSGSDKISLNEMDAVPSTRETDPFHFIGTDAFHNVAGELRYEVQGADTHIFADRDGNGMADFEIILNHVATVSSGDFFF